jgi:hypothetical protein
MSTKPTLAVLLLMGVAATGTGCGGNSDMARFGQLIAQRVTNAEGKRIPRDVPAAIPYASMGMQVGASDQGLLVLGTHTPPQAEWYGGESVMIRTRQGRVVRTAGLPFDLGGLEVLPQNARRPGESAVLRYDFPELGVFGAVARCSERDAGSETIEIVGARIDTRHIVERCDVAMMGWSFEAEYWRDARTGYVWRSRQHVHPKLPAVTLEVFRPEANGTG